MEIPFRNTIRNTPGKINVSELSAGLFFPIPEEIGSSRARQPVSLTRNVIRIAKNCIRSELSLCLIKHEEDCQSCRTFLLKTRILNENVSYFHEFKFSLNLFFLSHLKSKEDSDGILHFGLDCGQAPD